MTGRTALAALTLIAAGTAAIPAHACNQHLLVSGYFSNNVAVYDACDGHFLRQLDQAARGQRLDRSARRRTPYGVILGQLTFGGQPRAWGQFTAFDPGGQLGSKILRSHGRFTHWSLTVLSWSPYGQFMAGSRFNSLTLSQGVNDGHVASCGGARFAGFRAGDYWAYRQ
jgi:hypothetical protein